jgi:hypothetical protein
VRGGIRLDQGHGFEIVADELEDVLVSAGTGVVEPFALFGEFAVRSGCTVKSVSGLAWLSPAPTMAISEMPTGEPQRPMEA